MKYLARYTHRVAISNNRLLKLEEGQLTFRYKDYAADRQQKTMTLSAEEFLRRFVQHVLPRGFVKIRHYGLLANRQRTEKLHLCRRLLLPLTAVVNATDTPTQATSDKAEVAPAQRPVCPRCGGCRLERLELAQATEAAADRGENTSWQGSRHESSSTFLRKPTSPRGTRCAPVLRNWQPLHQPPPNTGPRPPPARVNRSGKSKKRLHSNPARLDSRLFTRSRGGLRLHRSPRVGPAVQFN